MKPPLANGKHVNFSMAPTSTAQTPQIMKRKIKIENIMDLNQMGTFYKRNQSYDHNDNNDNKMESKKSSYNNTFSIDH